MFGFLAYAEDDRENIDCAMDMKICPDGSSVGRTGPKCEFVCKGEKDDQRGEEFRDKFKGIRNDLKSSREDNKIKRDEFKGEARAVKDGLLEQREINKDKIKEMVQSVKTEREKFKTEFALRKEEAKTKIEEMRSSFKENLKKIKDERKVVASEKIVDIIINLNNKTTDNLLEKTDKIDNVLVSIESRITKAEERGLDVEVVKTEVEKSKVAIKTAREAISIQAEKVYSLNITDEASLRAEMQKLRDLFRADIKNVTEKVKLAHTAVRNTATTLAKIPKIDDTSDEVEDTSDDKEDDSDKVDANVSTSATITN